MGSNGLVLVRKVASGEIHRQVVALLDGLELDKQLAQIKTVFIKPNLVTDVPEYIAKGANTDLRVIEAVLQYLASYPHLHVTLGECDTGSRLKGRRLDNALELMGVSALTSRYRFSILNMTNDPNLREYRIEGGRKLRSIRLSPTLVESDLIINLPKMKTHKYATVTCSLKNMFGTIPDPLRVMYHHDIHAVIADLNRLYHHKMLVLLDGLIAMEGNGPLFGKSVEMNLMLAGRNAYAVDVIAAQLMGFDPGRIRHLHYFAQDQNQSPEQVEADTDLQPLQRQFTPARKNWFVSIEGELMRHRWIVRILFSDWFRRHVTYRIHPLLKRLRGGSFSWYIDRNNK